LKRIVLLVTMGVVIAAMVAASALSANAQDATMSGQADYCAPWSKEWNVSDGWWYFDWYRWCYDPSVGEVWFKEWGDSEWGDRVNLCPESGSCQVNIG
jgi:hypothetical protein